MAGDQLTGRYMEFPVSMRLLLMLVLWLTNRPTASSCIMSQEDLSHYLQAPVGNLGNTLWFSSSVVVFCRFRAYVSRCRFTFTALYWIHASKKLSIHELLHLIHYLHLNTPQNPPSSPGTSQSSAPTPSHHRLLLIVRPVSMQQLQAPRV